MDAVAKVFLGGGWAALPVLLSGIVFSSSLRKFGGVTNALGINLFGAVVGGILENVVMIGGNFGVGQSWPWRSMGSRRYACGRGLENSLKLLRCEHWIASSMGAKKNAFKPLDPKRNQQAGAGQGGQGTGRRPEGWKEQTERIRLKRIGKLN